MGNDNGASTTICKTAEGDHAKGNIRKPVPQRAAKHSVGVSWAFYGRTTRNPHQLDKRI